MQNAKQRLVALWVRLRPHSNGEPDPNDHLSWGEKIPLTLALVAQSYVIFNWYRLSVHGVVEWLDFIVAIAAGIALDLMVVTTTMGRREGRESFWSHATAFGAFVCSSAIALNVYSEQPLLPEGLLHIAFPLEVWLYSQHLATRKRASVASLAQAAEPELATMEAPATVVQVEPATAQPLLPSLTAGLQVDAIPMQEEAADFWGDVEEAQVPASGVQSRNMDAIFSEARAKMPDDVKEAEWLAWWLYEKEDMSQAEVARVMGKSVSTISRQCARVGEVMEA